MYNFLMSGGGTKFIDNWFMAGGRSKDTIGVSFPYATLATDKELGGTPEKYCSIETAEIMAVTAMINGQKIGFENTVGVGVTCSLNKVNERADRINKFSVAIIGPYGYYSEEIILDKRLYHNRRLQEEFLSFTLHDLLTNTPLIKFKHGELNKANNITAIYPGSFNPLHDAHTMIKLTAEKILNKEVEFEVSLNNVDKMNKSFSAIRGIITTAPTFVEKVKKLGNGKTFVIGYDTYERLIKMSVNDLPFFRSTDTHFLVFHRIINGVCSSTVGEKHSHQYDDLFTFVDTETYKPIDISSTEIRNAKGR